MKGALNFPSAGRWSGGSLLVFFNVLWVLQILHVAHILVAGLVFNPDELRSFRRGNDFVSHAAPPLSGFLLKDPESYKAKTQGPRLE